MCDCPPYSSSLPPVLAELKQGNLITSDECEGLYRVSQVCSVQSGKSSQVLTRSAEILLKHGYHDDSKFLSGNQLYSIPQLLSCVG